MTRISFLALAAALSACTLHGVSGTNGPKMADMNAPGTCFAVVSPVEGGGYVLATGVGTGSGDATAVHSKTLTAEQVDRAVAREREIMKVNPECLGTYVFDRGHADPKSLETAASGA